MLIIWEFNTRTVRVVGFRKEVEQLPLVSMNEVFTKVWKTAAQEGVRTLSGSYHEEKKMAWKVSAMNISKQSGESEEMSFKRMISLLYEFACTNDSAVEVSQNVAGNLIKREGIQRNLALFQAAVATRRLGAQAVMGVLDHHIASLMEERKKPKVQEITQVY